jgi:uncharacterized membrane protein HdeD (DUF308 family)
MNDWNEDTTTTTTERRRFPDPLALIVGIVTLVVSAYVLSDGAFNLPAIDTRWLIGGGALFVGLMLLGASLRPGRRRQR